jgi:hypothetical protein
MNWFDKYMPNQGSGYTTDYEMMGSYGQPASNYGNWANPPVQVNPINMGGMPPPPDLPTYQPYSMPYQMEDMAPSLGTYGSGATLPTNWTSGAADASGKSMFDSFLSNRDQQGWGGMAISGAMGLANTLLGYKQYSLAKDSLKTSREQFERNFAAQRNLTNSRLEDRQRARINSSGGTNANYESVGSYMDKYGIK